MDLRSDQENVVAAQHEKSIQWMRWCLRAGIVCGCVGIAGIDLFAGGPIFDALFIGLGWEDRAATRLVDVGSYVLLACIPFVLFRRGWPVLLFVSFWTTLRMVTMWRDNSWFPILVPAENAVRYLGPLALVGLSAFPENGTIPDRRKSYMTGLLRVAASATFIGHGLAALYHQGQFVDFIIAAGRDLGGISVPQSTAEGVLTGIGTLDLMVAVLILLPYRLRIVAGWMAFWGLLTASARIVRLGWDHIDFFLVRAMNWAVPLSLFVFWSRSNKEWNHENNHM